MAWEGRPNVAWKGAWTWRSVLYFLLLFWTYPLVSVGQAAVELQVHEQVTMLGSGGVGSNEADPASRNCVGKVVSPVSEQCSEGSSRARETNR